MYKRILFFLFIVSCNSGVNDYSYLTDKEWNDLFRKNLLLLEFSEDDLIYNRFMNNEFDSILLENYLNCTDLGYNVQEGIITKIKTQRNPEISINSLDSRFKFSSRLEMESKSNSIIRFSEPLKLNEDLILMASSISDNDNRKGKVIVIFLKRKNGYLSIVEYYDSDKQMYYSPVN